MHMSPDETAIVTEWYGAGSVPEIKSIKTRWADGATVSCEWIDASDRKFRAKALRPTTGCATWKILSTGW